MEGAWSHRHTPCPEKARKIAQKFPCFWTPIKVIKPRNLVPRQSHRAAETCPPLRCYPRKRRAVERPPQQAWKQNDKTKVDFPTIWGSKDLPCPSRLGGALAGFVLRLSCLQLAVAIWGKKKLQCRVGNRPQVSPGAFTVVWWFWMTRCYNSLPSGKQTVRQWKWPSRNSWFTPKNSMVIFQFAKNLSFPVGAWMGGPGDRSEAGVKGHRSGLPYRFSRLETPFS